MSIPAKLIEERAVIAQRGYGRDAVAPVLGQCRCDVFAVVIPCAGLRALDLTDMAMIGDEAGQHSHSAPIQQFGAAGDRNIGSGCNDAAAIHHDRGVVHRRTSLAVDQPDVGEGDGLAIRGANTKANEKYGRGGYVVPLGRPCCCYQSIHLRNS